MQACPECGQTVRRQPQGFTTVGGGTGSILPGNGGAASRRDHSHDDSAHVPNI